MSTGSGKWVESINTHTNHDLNMPSGLGILMWRTSADTEWLWMGRFESTGLQHAKEGDSVLKAKRRALFHMHDRVAAMMRDVEAGLKEADELLAQEDAP